MYKALMAGFVVLFSTATFAVDTDTINFIHAKTKSAIIDQCKKSIPGATDAACGCIGEKAEMSLDDSALKSCPEGTDMPKCVQGVVTKAAQVSVAADNLKACGVKKS